MALDAVLVIYLIINELIKFYYGLNEIDHNLSVIILRGITKLKI